MRIGIPRKRLASGIRVAAISRTVEQLLKLGLTIAIESSADRLASPDDRAFVQAGTEAVEGNSVQQSEIILKVNVSLNDEIALLDPGTTLVSFIWPTQNPELVQRLAERDVTVMAMNSVPCILRVQSLDALNSMASIAGYHAIVEATHEFGRLPTGQIAVVGKVPPAKAMVIGAGVAGLAAIGVANSLGVIVHTSDTRPEAKGQIQSTGAEFLELDFKEKASNGDGYIKVMSDAFIKAEMELFAAQAKEVGIAVTVALIPDKPTPKLITREMAGSMKAGSTITDLATQNGGNYEYTASGETFTMENGVKIVGYTDLPSRLPTRSSQLRGTNLVNLLKLSCKKKDGNITVDFDDAMIRGATVIRAGEVTWPASSIQVSAQLQAAQKVTPEAETEEEYVCPPWHKYTLTVSAIVLFGWMANIVPKEFFGHSTVFALACVVSCCVVRNVSHALHTPLMSITNTISGIIVVGILLQTGQSGWVNFLSSITMLIANINIFGGFAVTQRMLRMFREN